MAHTPRKASTPSDPRRRPRQTAEQTQAEILDAAGRRLAEGGPDALCLQDIARDVGISHPTILHHFGSREGLMEALEKRATSALTEEVGRLLLSGRGVHDEAGGPLLESVGRAMNEGGLARLVAWWVLRDPSADHEEAGKITARVVELIRLRLEEEQETLGGSAPSREEIAFTVRLAVLAMFGDALIGSQLAQVAAPQKDAESKRFRAWLGQLLAAHLRGAVTPLPEQNTGRQSD